MTVNEFAQDVHKNAVAHGWYDAPITFRGDMQAKSGGKPLFSGLYGIVT